MAMSEKAAIEQALAPETVESLSVDLRALGLTDGMTVIVHSSLSAIGWTAGGAQAVVEALLAVAGPKGTLVMPTHSGQVSDPATWVAPPVPADWHQPIRDHMPAYDPLLTPTRSMGAIVDCFLRHPDTHRSAHPSFSFGANGVHAARVLEPHEPAHMFDESSPLGRLYELKAMILLLGVGHINNTSLHLAESRASWAAKTPVAHGAPVMVDGRRRWVEWQSIEPDEDDFPKVGAAYSAAGGSERLGPVGSADCRLVPMRELVDFGIDWISANR